MKLYDDLRQAWRGLAHSPGFLAIAAGVFALGLAATIFMYAMINTTLRTPPPFPEAERLIGVLGADPLHGDYDDAIQYLDYLELKAETKTVDDMMGYYNGTMIVSGDGLPERYSGGFVTWNFWNVLRVKPYLGRAFNESDSAPNAQPTV